MSYLALAVSGSCRLSISSMSIWSSPLVQAISEAFQSKTADLVYLFYVSLICYSPYFYSMYTDIPPLPLIALQLWWALDLLKEDQAVSWKKIVGLGILSGVSMLIRPTTIIVMIAFWAVLFSEEIGRPLEDCYGDGHYDRLCLCRIEYGGQSSKSCTDLETRRVG